MSVKATHSQYAGMLSAWTRCRDVACGQDAVHARGEVYLPKLKDQTQDEYRAYVGRATFYNATYRTIDGLRGMVFRKAPKVTASSAVIDLCKDVTMTGQPLQVFLQNVTEESMMVGRVGVLVDYPNTDPQTVGRALTHADAAIMNIRPTMRIYQAEQIINWRTKHLNNKTVLQLVVLQEDADISVDEFENKTEPRWRVLDLVPGATVGSFKYRVRVFRWNDSTNTEEQIGNDVFPMMNRAPMDFIPFQFMGTDDIGPEVDDPPLIDLINVNLSHYKASADYEHGCHFTGLPTPVVSGYTPAIADNGTKESLYIGSSKAWIFPDKDANATFLEFKGEGLGALERNLDRKEKQMAVLGARMLEEQKRGVESAEAVALHRVGEQSMLANLAQTISLGMTQVLRWFSQWADSQEDCLIELNRDFFPVPMSPLQLTALVAAWQTGGISKETLFDNLKQGEVIAADRTFEDEEAKIWNGPLSSGAPGTGSGGAIA